MNEFQIFNFVSIAKQYFQIILSGNFNVYLFTLLVIPFYSVFLFIKIKKLFNFYIPLLIILSYLVFIFKGVPIVIQNIKFVNVILFYSILITNTLLLTDSKVYIREKKRVFIYLITLIIILLIVIPFLNITNILQRSELISSVTLFGVIMIFINRKVQERRLIFDRLNNIIKEEDNGSYNDIYINFSIKLFVTIILFSISLEIIYLLIDNLVFLLFLVQLSFLSLFLLPHKTLLFLKLNKRNYIILKDYMLKENINIVKKQKRTITATIDKESFKFFKL